MAREVVFSDGSSGKVRSFGVGLLLTVITLGIYYWFWYYFVNDELRDIGVAKGNRKLSESKPMLSLLAVTIGGYLVIPPLLSVYNYGVRIKRAQRAGGIPEYDQINPIFAFLMAILGFLLIPALIHYWYVTKHQNRAILAAGGADYHDS